MIYGYELIKYFSETENKLSFKEKTKKFLKDKEPYIVGTGVGLAGLGSGIGVYKVLNNNGQNKLQESLKKKNNKLEEAFNNELSNNDKIRDFNEDIFNKIENNINKKHDKLVDYANKNLTPGSEKYKKIIKRAEKYKNNSDFRDLVRDKVYHKNKKFVSYKNSNKIAAFDKKRNSMEEEISNKISKKSRKAGLLTGLGVAGTLGLAYGGNKLYNHYKNKKD